MNDKQRRNLDPHAPARAAMWIWSKQYSDQRGGSMDFWDGLNESEKRIARKCVEEIRKARDEITTSSTRTK